MTKDTVAENYPGFIQGQKDREVGQPYQTADLLIIPLIHSPPHLLIC